MENSNKQFAASLNVLQDAANKQAAFSRGIENLNGYKTFTTFYGDLTIAEHYGPDAIRETYARVVQDWFDNYKYFTEFVLCLNHKIWELYETNEPLAAVYNELWQKADALTCQWEGEAAEYYFRVTD